MHGLASSFWVMARLVEKLYPLYFRWSFQENEEDKQNKKNKAGKQNTEKEETNNHLKGEKHKTNTQNNGGAPAFKTIFKTKKPLAYQYKSNL